MVDTKIKSHDQGKQSGQMQCPNCNTPIPVTFDALLIDAKLVCPNKNCKTILGLNQANSGEAIKAIKTLKNRLDALGS